MNFGCDEAISKIDTTLRVVHIGGRGSGIGPVECLFKLGKDLSLSVFEADLDAKEKSWSNFAGQFKEYADSHGIKHTVIPHCLSDSVGERLFNVDVSPLSSSLYKVSPQAKDYVRIGEGKHEGKCRLIIGEICETARTIEIEVTTLDELYDRQTIQLPHFLSMDTQGSDIDILRGASKALQGDVLGVITEALYREFYDGQELSPSIFSFLQKHHFSLFDLYSSEYWYSGVIVGKGFLSTNEALFLRNFQYFVEKDNDPAKLLSNLSKLAIVAHCFERSDYAFQILEYIMSNLKHEWDSFVSQNDCSYLVNLAKLYQKVKVLKVEQSAIPTYSEDKKKSHNPFSEWKRRMAVARVEVAIVKDTLLKDAYLIGSLCLPRPIKKLIKKTILRNH